MLESQLKKPLQRICRKFEKVVNAKAFQTRLDSSCKEKLWLIPLAQNLMRTVWRFLVRTFLAWNVEENNSA